MRPAKNANASPLQVPKDKLNAKKFFEAMFATRNLNGTLLRVMEISKKENGKLILNVRSLCTKRLSLIAVDKMGG